MRHPEIDQDQIKKICNVCRREGSNRAVSLECGLCQAPLCRSCAEILPEKAFSLLSEIPQDLTHASYCPPCYDQKIAPALANYEETLARARKVHFWPKSYRGNIPILKKSQEELAVQGGSDKDAVLLRLGFMAAERGFNALIKGELKSRKVRNHGYQKLEWSGHALPCQVDEDKLERQEFVEAHWRVLHHR